MKLPLEEESPEPSVTDEASGTDLSMGRISEMEQRVKCLEAEVHQLKTDGPQSVLHLEDKIIKNLTGFDKNKFFIIYDFFSLKEDLTVSKTRGNKVLPEDQLFITLIKLRQGLTNNVLEFMFKIAKTTTHTIFTRCLAIIYHKCKAINIWPSRDQVQAYMPPMFHKHFPACRVIIDATEFFMEKPGNPIHQQASFGTYKNNNTLKSLIGITPSGAISFISDLWLGGISDKEITERSGLLDLLEAGDTVLADRGFTCLQGDLEKKGITLATPTFLRDKIQFEVEERSENKRVSSHRCHVERAIGKIKRFKILDDVPTTMKNFEQMYYVCAFLSNFIEPLISCTSTGNGDK